MKKQPCFAGAGHGIPLLSAGAALLTAGMLLATAFLSPGQTQQSSQQQPDSVVAVVATAQGLPFVPADQRPFGTYWAVRNSLPCLAAPLPFPPFDPTTVVYAIGGGLFLADETAGPLAPRLPAPYGRRALSTADYAAILQAQVDELQNFVSIGTSGYYRAQISVTNDVSGATTHTVTSPQPVGVQVYGFGWCDAYCFCGGLVK